MDVQVEIEQGRVSWVSSVGDAVIVFGAELQIKEVPTLFKNDYSSIMIGALPFSEKNK